MSVTPNTELRLLKCNLNLDNNNQLTFSNATAQYNYFNGLTHKTITDISYQRKDSYVRFPEHIDNLIEYNYVMYKNSNYSNKWFYAYVTRMEYENDNCTRVYIKTDVFQTWQFDLTYMESFVEREHVNDDTLGKNTVPEQLETGEYIVNDHLSDAYNNHLTIVYGTNMDVNLDRTYGNVYNGLPSAVTYVHRDQMIGGLGSVAYDLDYLANAGHVDEVKSLFIVPEWILGSSASISGEVAGSDNPATFDLGISRISSLNGYTPKNKKLLTYPYCYILFTNGSGDSAIYHQELWKLNNHNDMVVRVYGVLCPGCSVRAYPVEYNGDGLGIDYGLTLGKFPELNWATDQYTNWLTQNSVNMGIGVASSALSLGIGVATANPIAIAGGITAVSQTLAQVHQAEFIPTQIRGSANAGDVNATIYANRFHTYRMTIKSEYAKIIDDFFSMYGYKVNRLKIPNITGRSNWNYVKLINPNIEGYIPQEDLSEIKDLFSNGITLWHTTSHFLDYSQNNSII